MERMEQKLKYDFLIIDPASTEFNRGSFCYLPYILYCSLKSAGFTVKLIEDFTVATIDDLPEANSILIGLWSYPQIEACLVLNRFLEGEISFFGYTPLISKFRLPLYTPSNDTILDGISNYPEYYDDFKYLLLSDCDMHLSKYSGIVYPLFSSYGCPRSCSFCPSSVNCNRTRISLSSNRVMSLLESCREQGVRNIHFTDEDFFYDTARAAEILKAQVGEGMNFIALGSVNKVIEFIEVFGQELLNESGVRLIEVGFETADSELSASMHKPKLSTYEYLSSICTKVDIFWLTLTFFPGETIGTLNKTGEFLKKHGHVLSDLYGRVATNSTEGGLGQFFQLYDGVSGYDDLLSEGILLTERPMRLIPSFIPFSFLNSEIKEFREIRQEELTWFNLYKVSHNFPLQKSPIGELTDSIDGYIFYAICARLGIIK